MKTSILKLLFRKFGKMSKFIPILFLGFVFTNPLFAQQNDPPNASEFKDVSELLDLSPQDLDAFTKQAKHKVEEFTNNLSTIADINKGSAIRDIAVESSLKLFVNPDSNIIESSYLLNGAWKIKKRTIREYLTRLRSITLTKVAIDNYNMVYVSDFVKSPDGKRYYATATFFQVYTVYASESIRYRDKTVKTVTIILELIEDEVYGEKRWVIRLGDVKVAETKLE